MGSGMLSEINSASPSGILSDKYSEIQSGTCSDILSGILSDIYSGILSDILSGGLSDILCDIFSGILLGSLSDIYSDILSGILPDRNSDSPSGRYLQRCPLGSGDPRLRSSSAHCNQELAERRRRRRRRRRTRRIRRKRKAIYKISQISPARWGEPTSSSLLYSNSQQVLKHLGALHVQTCHGTSGNFSWATLRISA